jgi:hypothetical protein
VQEWGKTRRHRFFTTIQKLVEDVPRGRWVRNDQREAFWNSVAFYNFVQSFVGAQPRCRPTSEMWDAAAKPFLEVLGKLQPQILIVLGSELRSHLPRFSAEIRPCFIQHPSSRSFHFDESQDTIRRVLRGGN